MNLASVGEESDASSSEEVPVNLECVNICDFFVLADIGRHLSNQNDTSIEECEDRCETDVSETTHVLNQRQWEQDK